jgi:hypothetical protein
MSATSPTTKDFAKEYEYTDVEEDIIIPADVYLGLKWKDEQGRECETVCSKFSYRDGKRVAELSYRTWVGTMAIGAMHFYAEIKVSGPSVQIKGEKYLCCGGYGPERPYFASLDMKVKRRLTKVEKDMDDLPVGKIGDWTHRFNLPTDLLPAALANFKKKFGPGWVLVGHRECDHNGNGVGDEEVLAET